MIAEYEKELKFDFSCNNVWSFLSCIFNDVVWFCGDIYNISSLALIAGTLHGMKEIFIGFDTS